MDRDVQVGVAFVAAVSCWLIALVLAEAATGGGLELVVYALTAAFGLEFLWSSWPRLWRPRSDP